MTPAKTDLHTFMQAILDKKNGFELGDPWKYSEEALAVVVPILRKKASKRKYSTMYEVLKQMKMEDTGHIDKVGIQNLTGEAVFVRVGTIFEGQTQNRASQHSGVFQPGKTEINVRCVHQTHGIRTGSEMKYGDIAPLSVTINLMKGTQWDVWNSVRNYTSDKSDTVTEHLGSSPPHNYNTSFVHGVSQNIVGLRSCALSDNRISLCTGSVSSLSPPSYSGVLCSVTGAVSPEYQQPKQGSDDLLGHIKAKAAGQKLLDEMMQKVPLFEFQCGAVIFSPLGVVAVETFDHPMSWEAIKKEVIEKHGDKIMETQADHLFELKPERIVPALQKFIDKFTNFEERTVSKDGFSETRMIVGDKIVGEYTLVEGKVIHAIIVKEE